MLTRNRLLASTGRATAFVAVAALALTAIGPATAASPPKGFATTVADHSATDFSSAGRRHYRGGGGAAAAAAFAGIVGTGLAIAATQNRDDYYYDGGPGYYGGPAYYRSPYDSYGSYGGGPTYYGGNSGHSNAARSHGFAVPDGK